MLASVKGGNFLFECWIWLESWCILPVNTVSWAGQVENVWGKRQGSEGLVQNSLFSFCFPSRLQTRCVSCPLGLIFNCDLIHFFGERWWCAGSYTHLKSPRFDFSRRYTFVAVFIFVFDSHEKMWVYVMVSPLCYLLCCTYSYHFTCLDHISRTEHCQTALTKYFTCFVQHKLKLCIVVNINWSMTIPLLLTFMYNQRRQLICFLIWPKL